MSGHMDRLRKTIFPALSFRKFRLLMLGALMSSVGSWLQSTALLWFIRERTGSESWVGFANMVNWVPVLLLGLFSGAIADFFDRRKVILVTQAVMMLAALGIGVCLSLGLNSLALIISVLGVSGIAYSFFVVTWVATFPDLVSADVLLNAVSLNNAQFNLARFIGPVLGGLVLMWSAAAAFYLNALSFFCFIALIYLARLELPLPTAPTGSTLDHIREGLAYVRSNPWMIRLLGTVGVLSFFGYSFIVLIPAVSKEVLGKGEGGYGLLMGMTGLGAVAAMPLVAVLDEFMKENEIIKLSTSLFAALLIGFALSEYYWLSCLLAVGVGGAYLMFNSAASTVLQSRSTHDMTGRVMSLMAIMFLGVFPLGGLALGFLADVFSVRTALLIGGTACAAMALVLLVFPSFSREFISENHKEAEEAR